VSTFDQLAVHALLPVGASEVGSPRTAKVEVERVSSKNMFCSHALDRTPAKAFDLLMTK